MKSHPHPDKTPATDLTPGLMYGPEGLGMEGPVLMVYDDVDTLGLVLQELLDVNVDSARCYEDDVTLVSDPVLTALMGNLAVQRRIQADELTRYMSDHARQPIATGTFTGTLHRAWLRLRAAISRDDDGLILEQAEAVEDHVLDAYTRAVESDVPRDAQAMLIRHRERAEADHNRVRALRNAHRRAVA